MSELTLDQIFKKIEHLRIFIIGLKSGLNCLKFVSRVRTVTRFNNVLTFQLILRFLVE